MYHASNKIKPDYALLMLTGLLFAVVCAVFQASNGIQWASLAIEPTLDGQYWRLLTGHLIHKDWQHFAMNMLGLNLCLAVFAKDLAAKHWLLSFIFIALFSSLGMLQLYPLNYRYLGFSDVLHGWILLGAAAIFHKEPRLAVIVFVLFWLKIIEENANFTFFTSYGVSGGVAKKSHILGAIGGLLYAVIFLPTFRGALVRYIPGNKKGP